ncbi:hypothetical protein EYF80_040918 [Liparis tanakae]|uniref:Uncharacterized protein n=1 Tax=Liparis tanakae TaxID=230148 RepID=A0A4Z2G6Z6_9TELE|nr:hypothetical protein EYF80_040918 [Liparis tanakae]
MMTVFTETRHGDKPRPSPHSSHAGQALGESGPSPQELTVAGTSCSFSLTHTRVPWITDTQTLELGNRDIKPACLVPDSGSSACHIPAHKAIILKVVL